MNNLSAATNNILMENYKNTNDITNDVGEIILSAQQTAYKAVDAVLVQRNCQKSLANSSEKVLPKRIFIVFICFIRPIRRFSTQRVENLNYCHGHIIVCLFM